MADSTLNMTLISHSPRAYGFYATLYKFSLSEYLAVISVEIHNNRTKPDNNIRFMIELLAKDIKKYNSNNLKDYIAAKTDKHKTRF